MSRSVQSLPSWLLAVLVAVSWLGLLVHNFLESVDGSTLAVGLVSAGLFLGWWRIPSRRSAMAWILLGMGMVQLVGAAVTVVPFGFLPFTPSQTLGHYLVHVEYGASQVPLAGATIKQLRRDSGKSQA
ncbi:MAG TPA: hypothetical protein VF906_00865 [Candidatus Bathyarchaeia archaeon]